jgi:hypothetical protein
MSDVAHDLILKVCIMSSHPVDAWLAANALNATVQLDALLSEDAAYISPFHDHPRIGRQAARLQISGMLKLVAEGEKKYLRQIIGSHDAMLEFEATLDRLTLNGVEILKWDDDCKITEVRIMLRPVDAAGIARGRMEKLLLSKKLT